MSRAVATVVCGILVALAPAAPAAGDEVRVLKLESRHVAGAVWASVLLPDGYTPARAYPVLYLLHGFDETHGHWLAPTRGDLRRILGDFRGIVVMPDQRAGFSVDHFNGGRRADPAWTRFFVEELIPRVHRTFRIRAGRRWHAIAGSSMGGFGAIFLASQRPDYFGSAASFSGSLNIQRPETATTIPDYEWIFGAPDGAYAAAHNPPRLVANLAHTRLLALVGDGVPDRPPEAGADYLGDRATLAVGGSALEVSSRNQTEDFAQAARAAGVAVDHRVLHGVHDWPYWRDHLALALAWNPFAAVVQAPRRWSFRTIRSKGRAWDIRYWFWSPPEEALVLRFRNGVLSGEGSGRVTVTGRCAFTASLPFSRRCRRRGARRAGRPSSKRVPRPKRSKPMSSRSP